MKDLEHHKRWLQKLGALELSSGTERNSKGQTSASVTANVVIYIGIIAGKELLYSNDKNMHNTRKWRELNYNFFAYQTLNVLVIK